MSEPDDASLLRCDFLRCGGLEGEEEGEDLAEDIVGVS